MKFKKLSGALLASLMIHTAIALLAGGYWVTKTPQPDDSLSIEILSPISPPQPRALMQPESTPQKIVQVKVTFPRGGLAMVQAIGAQPSPPSARRPIQQMQAVSHYQPSSVLEFSSKMLRIDSPMAMRVDSVIAAPGLYDSPSNKPQTGSTPTEVVAKIQMSSTAAAETIYRKAPQLKPPNGAAYPDMYFKSSGANPFLDTEDEHLSTFAMDVDTASYSITRRYLTEGHLPPSEAVRVEEFVNAFKYDYADPTDGAFAIHLEGAPSIFAYSKRTHLLRIGLKGRVISDQDRKDAALTFVVDVSGSMERENRLGLVKRALTLLVDQLRPTDKVGIVVYGSPGRLVLPHTGVNRRA